LSSELLDDLLLGDGEGSRFALQKIDVVVAKQPGDPLHKGLDPKAVSCGGVLLERAVDGRQLKVVSNPSPYSPCAVGGVKVGDCVVAVNHVAVSARDPKDGSRFAATPLVETFLRQVDRTKRPLTLTFERKVNSAAAAAQTLKSVFGEAVSADLVGAGGGVGQKQPPPSFEVSLSVPEKQPWASLKMDVALRKGSVTVTRAEPYGPGHSGLGFRVGDVVVASSSSSSSLTRHHAGSLTVQKFASIVCKDKRPVAVAVERRKCSANGELLEGKQRRRAVWDRGHGGDCAQQRRRRGSGVSERERPG